MEIVQEQMSKEGEIFRKELRRREQELGSEGVNQLLAFSSPSTLAHTALTHCQQNDLTGALLTGTLLTDFKQHKKD